MELYKLRIKIINLKVYIIIENVKWKIFVNYVKKRCFKIMKCKNDF